MLYKSHYQTRSYQPKYIFSTTRQLSTRIMYISVEYFCDAYWKSQDSIEKRNQHNYTLRTYTRKVSSHEYVYCIQVHKWSSTARAIQNSSKKRMSRKKRKREKKRNQNSRMFQDELRHSPNLSCRLYSSRRVAWKMAGRWSKSYLDRGRWSDPVQKPVGWPVNNQPGVIIINHGVIPRPSSLCKHSYRKSWVGTRPASKRNKRFGSVTTVCRDIKAGSRPLATTKESDTRVNDDKSPACLWKPLSLSLSRFLLPGHRRHSRSQPPVTGQSSSSVETFQAGGRFRERWDIAIPRTSFVVAR